MKYTPRLILLSFAALFCVVMVGCGGDKIDISSDSAYNESLKKIYEALPEAERAEFRDNFGAILTHALGIGSETMNENEMYTIYGLAKLFGGADGPKMLRPVNA